MSTSAQTTHTERPIIFGAESVRAILDGRKTQTRRVVKPQPRFTHYLQPMFGASPDGHTFGEPGLWREVGPDYPDCGEDDRRCPFGAVGDRLWCRETFSRPYVATEHDHGCIYLADGPDHVTSLDQRKRNWGKGDGAWMSPIFMPRNVSRLTLEVTNVRVERLQEMPYGDIRREGVGCPTHDFESGFCTSACGDLVREWIRSWDALNAKRGFPWAESPWVWVIDFQMVAA